MLLLTLSPCLGLINRKLEFIILVSSQLVSLSTKCDDPAVSENSNVYSYDVSGVRLQKPFTPSANSCGQLCGGESAYARLSGQGCVCWPYLSTWLAHSSLHNQTCADGDPSLASSSHKLTQALDPDTAGPLMDVEVRAAVFQAHISTHGHHDRWWYPRGL